MSWNIKTPGDYINGPLTVVGAVTLNSTFTVSGVSRFFSTGDGLFVSGNAGPDLYTIGVNYYNNSGTESVQVSPRPSWKIEHKNSSDALAYFDVGFRAANAAAGTFTSRFKIDGSGNAGFGLSNFAYKLNAAGLIAAVDPSFTGTGGSLIGALLNNDNVSPGLDLRRWTGTAGTHGVAYLGVEASGMVRLYNHQQASNTKATQNTLSIDANGNLTANIGNIGFGTANKGIDFSVNANAAGATSELLNDYEEGTWTPTISASVGTPTTTTINLATYTKIGRIVSATFDISIVNLGTASGLLQFTLPFSQGTDNNIGCLREVGATALMGQVGSLGALTSFAALYNNATVWVNGYRIRGTYTYTV
jgi:hypothetical protein